MLTARVNRRSLPTRTVEEKHILDELDELIPGVRSSRRDPAGRQGASPAKAAQTGLMRGLCAPIFREMEARMGRKIDEPLPGDLTEEELSQALDKALDNFQAAFSTGWLAGESV